MPTSRTLAFTPSGTQVVNQFSVDGTTLSVDALNNSVGIGISNPGAQLDVRSGLANVNVARIGNASQNILFGVSTSNNGAYITTASGTTNSLRLGVNGSEHMRIDATTATLGNVGIGTGNNAVNYALQVHRTGITDVYEQFTNGQVGSAATDGLKIGVSSTGDAIINNQEANNLIIYTNNSEKIRVQSNGNVGINNTTPTQSLDVTGNVKFSGALMPNNTAVAAGQVLSSAGVGAAPIWANSPNVSTVICDLSGATSTQMATLNTVYKTGAKITLPSGKWLVSAGTAARLYNAGSSGIGADGQLWVHFYISDSNTTYANSSDIVSGTGTAGAGAIHRGGIFGMAI